MGIAHFTFDLGPGNQGGHRVDHDHIYGAAAQQHIGDLQGLLAGIGLGYQKLVAVDAQLPGIRFVQGVLGVDESRDAPLLLGIGNGVQGQGGLAG